MLTLAPQDLARLQQSANIWLATVRPNGKPHLVPIWFVWVENKVYICTAAGSVKARNIAANPHVMFSLEDGNDPLVMEGQARIVPQAPEAVVVAFRRKYGWTITNDETYNTLIEISPYRIVR